MSLDPASFELAGRPVHRIGFGAMQLPGKGVMGPPRDRGEAVAVVRRALELGVDHIDTAEFYGPRVANELLREALHPYPAGLALVSKVGARRDDAGAWLAAQRPEELRAGIEANLETLGVDRLTAVNLRRHPDADVPLDEQLDAMEQARDDGLVEGIGLSNVTLDQLDRALERGPVACVQNAYSVLDRSSEPVLRRCEERGVAFVPFFPLGSAFGVAPVREHPVVTATAERLGVTPAQVALAWVLAQSPCTLLIPGTSSLAHLEDNMAVGGVLLDEQARRELDGLASAEGSPQH